MNNPTSTNPNTDRNTNNEWKGSQESGNKDSSGRSAGWVSKRDRHMQLINTSIYDKEKVLHVSTSAHHTPKQANVGGVTFYRSRNGNLYRSGLVKARKNNGPRRKIDKLCRHFTATGRCLKGPLCPFTHDPNAVAICLDYLQKGSCTAGESCDLSHVATPQRVPACMHYLRGHCSNPECRYAHDIARKALAVLNATFVNVPIMLTLVKGQRNPGKSSDDSSDLSSDEGDFEEIDSEDVDSDGLDEDMIDAPDSDDAHALSQQQDFVKF
ncbi:hypothetical protein G7Y79_00036g072810 [Physcia stellaris]|nr:hypothetical protein G7Y79_00036g072810 [Physcia stellaris]